MANSENALRTLRLVALDESHLGDLVRIERVSNGAPWSEQAFRNELGHAHGLFRVALLDGKPVGYAGAWLLVDEAHVTTVAVDPEFRQRGIARRLMEELLREAARRGMTCCTLEVRAGNVAALALYESMAFVRAALRKGYYPDNREDAVVMWLYNLTAWAG